MLFIVTQTVYKYNSSKVVQLRDQILHRIREYTLRTSDFEAECRGNNLDSFYYQFDCLIIT
jgi:hypothetical protein